MRSNDEIGRLALAFNKMAADVEEHQRAAVSQERIRRELELGRQIQHDMLPQGPLMFGLTEIKGVSVPAREVGGDFFNYFQLRDGRVALLVGDVSGKGVGAALLMAKLQAALRTRLAPGQDLASLAQELDVDIDSHDDGPRLCHAVVGILDPPRAGCAASTPATIRNTCCAATVASKRMESTSRPIGLLSGGGYTEQVLTWPPATLLSSTRWLVEAETPTATCSVGAPRTGAGRSRDVGADQVMAKVEADVSASGPGRDAGRRRKMGGQGRLTSRAATGAEQRRAAARPRRIGQCPTLRTGRNATTRTSATLPVSVFSVMMPASASSRRTLSGVTPCISSWSRSIGTPLRPAAG